MIGVSPRGSPSPSLSPSSRPGSSAGGGTSQVFRARWWRPLAPPLLAVAVLMTVTAASTMAASPYQASVDVNTTGFNPPCDGDANFIVPKMQTAAKAAYARLGHASEDYTGAQFTRAETLK